MFALIDDMFKTKWSIGAEVRVEARPTHGDSYYNGRVGIVVEDATDWDEDTIWTQVIVEFADGSRGCIRDHNLHQL